MTVFQMGSISFHCLRAFLVNTELYLLPLSRIFCCRDGVALPRVDVVQYPPALTAFFVSLGRRRLSVLEP